MVEKKLKNQIYDNCYICNSSCLKAYWDDELEYYIYLQDEYSVCRQCQSLTASDLHHQPPQQFSSMKETT